MYIYSFLIVVVVRYFCLSINVYIVLVTQSQKHLKQRETDLRNLKNRINKQKTNRKHVTVREREKEINWLDH